MGIETIELKSTLTEEKLKRKKGV
jgi:hypothetical protein